MYRRFLQVRVATDIIATSSTSAAGSLTPRLPHCCREGFTQELSSVTASDEQKQKMAEILMRLHQQQLEDESAISEGSESDEEPHLVAGLPLERAILLSEVRLGLENLLPTATNVCVFLKGR